MERNYPTQRRCLCCWSDLLGFGSPLRDHGWNNSEGVLTALGRVVDLQKEVSSSILTTNERVFLINDGVARNFDITACVESRVLIQWIYRLIASHANFNLLEAERNNPGIRSVLTSSFRLEYGPSNRTDEEIMSDRVHQPSLFGSGSEPEIVVYCPWEFQMNIAFAKAYYLESQGSKIGLRGREFYIDDEVVALLKGLKKAELNRENRCYIEFLTRRVLHRYGPKFVPFLGPLTYPNPIDDRRFFLLLSKEPVKFGSAIVWRLIGFSNPEAANEVLLTDVEEFHNSFNPDRRKRLCGVPE